MSSLIWVVIFQAELWLLISTVGISSVEQLVQQQTSNWNVMDSNPTSATEFLNSWLESLSVETLIRHSENKNITKVKLS